MHVMAVLHVSAHGVMQKRARLAVVLGLVKAGGLQRRHEVRLLEEDPWDQSRAVS